MADQYPPSDEADAAPRLGALRFVDPQHTDAFRLTTVRATRPAPMRRCGQDGELHAVLPGGGRERGLEEWLAETWTTSLVVLDLDAADGAPGGGPAVVHAWYAGAEHPDGPVDPGSLLLGASMTKSALAHLVGLAVADGSLRVEDRVVDHVPELAGTGWEPCTVEHVLTMTTGTAWVEDHRDRHGPAVALMSTFDAAAGGASRDLLREVKPAHEPGTRWAYSTADSQVLDWVREAATGEDYPTALARLWSLVGAESDAVVATDAAGVALAGGGLAATATDWARLAALQHRGTWDGEQVLPTGWVEEASRPARPWLAPGMLPVEITTHAGFGRHWWPLDAEGRRVTSDGSRGQLGLCDRDLGVAVLKTSAWPYADTWTDRALRDLSYLGLPRIAQAAAARRLSPYGSPPGTPSDA